MDLLLGHVGSKYLGFVVLLELYHFFFLLVIRFSLAFLHSIHHSQAIFCHPISIILVRA